MFERAYSDEAQMTALLELLRSEDGRKLERTLRDAMFRMAEAQARRRDMSIQRKLDRLARQLAQRVLEYQKTGR